MPRADLYHILGLKPGASDKEIKSAYRKLAFKYHPDKNPSASAAREFNKLTDAYDKLLQRKETNQPPSGGMSREEAADIIRRERQKAWQRAQQQRAREEESRKRFLESEWYDAWLLLRYVFHALVLLFSIAAVITPFILAVLVDPAAFLATIYFVIIGAFLMGYIYERRDVWFRLGRFNLTREQVKAWFRVPRAKSSTTRCRFSRDQFATGKPYTLELVKVLDIQTRSFGAMDHEARYKRKTKRIRVPRSAKAQFWHRITSLIKVITVFGFLVFFPVSSILWRFLAGLLAGGIISVAVRMIVHVRSQSSYLLTPSLLIKMGIWVIALLSISHFGPGFDIHLTTYVYFVVGALLLFLDILYDLVLGFFPFYNKLTRPLISQGTQLDELYRQGYQNYQEFPVYSILYPLVRWLF